MIKKSKDGEYTVTCDSCGFSETIDTQGDIVAFKEIIKENGWVSKHRFRNLCEDCEYEKGAKP